MVTLEIHAVDAGDGMHQAVARDVSAWMSEDAARQASDKRCRDALDRATEGIWILDERGRFTYVNDAACVILGRTRDQILASEVRALVREDQHATLDAAMRSVQEAGEASCRLAFERGDGQDLLLEIHGVALDAGACQTIVRDVSAEGHPAAAA